MSVEIFNHYAHDQRHPKLDDILEAVEMWVDDVTPKLDRLKIWVSPSDPESCPGFVMAMGYPKMTKIVFVSDDVMGEGDWASGGLKLLDDMHSFLVEHREANP